MAYFMYQRPLTALEPAPALPSGVRLVFWRPRWRQPLHPGLAGLPFLAWSLLHFLGLFRNRDYAMVLLFREGRLVHRTCLLPPLFRFPFLPPGDLQAAGLWTDPAERGRGLALVALGEALRRLEDPGRTLWYLTRVDNRASIHLAEKARFTRFGRVERVNRLGLRVLGRFLLEERFPPSLRRAERPEG
jgi:RimJ/RimL family protein N-acetyltransferase